MEQVAVAVGSIEALTPSSHEVTVIQASVEDLREGGFYDTTETLCYALELARSRIASNFNMGSSRERRTIYNNNVIDFEERRTRNTRGPTKQSLSL